MDLSKPSSDKEKDDGNSSAYKVTISLAESAEDQPNKADCSVKTMSETCDQSADQKCDEETSADQKCDQGLSADQKCDQSLSADQKCDQGQSADQTSPQTSTADEDSSFEKESTARQVLLISEVSIEEQGCCPEPSTLDKQKNPDGDLPATVASEQQTCKEKETTDVSVEKQGNTSPTEDQKSPDGVLPANVASEQQTRKEKETSDSVSKKSNQPSSSTEDATESETDDTSKKDLIDSSTKRSEKDVADDDIVDVSFQPGGSSNQTDKATTTAAEPTTAQKRHSYGTRYSNQNSKKPRKTWNFVVQDSESDDDDKIPVQTSNKPKKLAPRDQAFTVQDFTGSNVTFDVTQLQQLKTTTGETITKVDMKFPDGSSVFKSASTGQLYHLMKIPQRSHNMPAKEQLALNRGGIRLSREYLLVPLKQAPPAPRPPKEKKTSLTSVGKDVYSSKNVRRCAVKTCQNNSKWFPDLTFFRCPRKEPIFTEWCMRIGRPDLIEKQKGLKHMKRFVCALHFEDKYVGSKRLYARAGSDAVPTLLLPGSDSQPTDAIPAVVTGQPVKRRRLPGADSQPTDIISAGFHLNKQQISSANLKKSSSDQPTNDGMAQTSKSQVKVAALVIKSPDKITAPVIKSQVKIAAPEIIDQLEDVVLRNPTFRNEDQTLTCRVRVAPMSTLYITWYHNGEKIHQPFDHFKPNYARDVTDGEISTVSLSIHSPTGSDAGIFICEIGNEKGEVMSACHVSFEGYDAEATHPMLNHICMKCMRNREPNRQGPDLLVDLFNNVRQEMKEFDSVGEKSKTGINFIKKLENIKMSSLKEEKALTLSCVVDDPEVSLRWFKNGRKINKCKHYEMAMCKNPSSKYIVLRVDPLVKNNDGGIYTCVASNMKQIHATTSCYVSTETNQSQKSANVTDNDIPPSQQDVLQPLTHVQPLSNIQPLAQVQPLAHLQPLVYVQPPPEVPQSTSKKHKKKSKHKHKSKSKDASSTLSSLPQATSVAVAPSHVIGQQVPVMMVNQAPTIVYLQPSQVVSQPASKGQKLSLPNVASSLQASHPQATSGVATNVVPATAVNPAPRVVYVQQTQGITQPASKRPKLSVPPKFAASSASSSNPQVAAEADVDYRVPFTRLNSVQSYSASTTGNSVSTYLSLNQRRQNSEQELSELIKSIKPVLDMQLPQYEVNPLSLPSFDDDVKPIFHKKLEDQIVDGGISARRSVTFRCELNVSSAKQYWFHNGRQIVPCFDYRIGKGLDKNEMRTQGILSILGVEKEDIGVYTCIASNGAGALSTSCFLSIASEDYIWPPYSCDMCTAKSRNNPSDIIRQAVKDSEIIDNAEVSEVLMESEKSSKDLGKEIKAGTSKSLVDKRTKESELSDESEKGKKDTGNTSESDVDKQSAKEILDTIEESEQAQEDPFPTVCSDTILNLVDQMLFESKLLVVKELTGSKHSASKAVTLSCQFSQHDNMDIKWLFLGLEIKNCSHRRLETKKGPKGGLIASLTLSTLRVVDMGIYTCVATWNGEMVSTSCNLTSQGRAYMTEYVKSCDKCVTRKSEFEMKRKQAVDLIRDLNKMRSYILEEPFGDEFVSLGKSSSRRDMNQNGLPSDIINSIAAVNEAQKRVATSSPLEVQGLDDDKTILIKKLANQNGKLRDYIHNYAVKHKRKSRNLCQKIRRLKGKVVKRSQKKDRATQTLSKFDPQKELQKCQYHMKSLQHRVGVLGAKVGQGTRQNESLKQAVETNRTIRLQLEKQIEELQQRQQTIVYDQFGRSITSP